MFRDKGEVMRILLTGSTGYIGRRLIPVLLDQGHEIICAVRDKERLGLNASELESGLIEIVECDFLDPVSLSNLPLDIEAAYYLIHSMSSSASMFDKMERKMAENFKSYLDKSQAKQCIYLSGIVNDEALSTHLLSRLETEKILGESSVSLTVLRAAIIIGSGSASFEIIRDITEKLPVMIAPKWLKTRCQPIGIRDVLSYLSGILLREDCFGRSFDIGGPEVMTYKSMIEGYAKVRGFKRLIISVPVMTPKLSSYWLYFVTSTSFPLAQSLVSSMKNEVVVKDNSIQDIIPLDLLSYQESLELALGKIKQNSVISSWKDALSSGTISAQAMNYIEVPEEAVFKDKRMFEIEEGRSENVIYNIWSIGGKKGWYYGDWLWRMRGVMDKAVGGVGLRRGRRNQEHLVAGDPLDFWRVLVADREKGRLLLYAEMKLPGDAWLEFKIVKENGKQYLSQVATFRPRGLLGRMYWYSVYPLHGLVFPGMAKGIVGN